MVPAEHVPFRVRIGVTGHRTLLREVEVRAALRHVLEGKMEGLFRDEWQAFATAPNTPLKYKVVTSLADGADQVVTDEIRLATGALVTTVLPLEESEYRARVSATAKFAELLAEDRNPRRMRRLPLAVEFYQATPQEIDAKREEAYDAAGRYVVDHCDILIAVWDQANRNAPAGARNPGDGTRHTVEYAEARLRPVIIIDPNDPQADPVIKAGNGLSARAVPALEAFNTLRLDAKEDQTKRAKTYKNIFGLDNQIPEATRQMIRHELIPWYVRAERVAAWNQKWFQRAGLLGYALAALAVVFVSIAVLFPTLATYMYGLELLCLSSILGIVAWTSRKRTHQKWIESRFLAERLRSAFYVAACGLEVSPVEVPPFLGVAHQPDDWMVRVFEEVWARLPQLPGCTTPPCTPYRDFIRDSWIQSQIDHHEGKAKERHKTSRLLEHAGLAVFAIALLAAAAHFFAGETLAREFHAGELALTMVAISFPAIGSAMAGIRIHREYARLVKRSLQMVSALKDLEARLTDAEQPAELEALVRETEELMLRESQEWLMLMRFARVEAG